MEDVLVHGRVGFDEATREEDPGDSERGDRAEMHGPRRVMAEDVRDGVASSAGREQHPRREAKRGGVDDRDPHQDRAAPRT